MGRRWQPYGWRKHLQNNPGSILSQQQGTQLHSPEKISGRNLSMDQQSAESFQSHYHSCLSTSWTCACSQPTVIREEKRETRQFSRFGLTDFDMRQITGERWWNQLIKALRTEKYLYAFVWFACLLTIMEMAWVASKQAPSVSRVRWFSEKTPTQGVSCFCLIWNLQQLRQLLNMEPPATQATRLQASAALGAQLEWVLTMFTLVPHKLG